MPMHWDLILKKATGEWVLYLCDDDALLPHCLEYLTNCFKGYPDIELYRFSNIRYYYGEDNNTSANYLRFSRKFDNSVTIHDSSKETRKRFQMMHLKNPTFPRACIKKDFLDRIRTRYGKVFFNWAPDISGGLVYLANSAKYGQVQLPLLIAGKGGQSYGARDKPNMLFEYLSQVPEFNGCWDYSPYKDLFVTANGIVDTFYKVKFELLPEELEGAEINPIIMRVYLLKDIKNYLKNGIEGYSELYGRVRRDLIRYLFLSPTNLSAGLQVMYKKKIHPYVRYVKMKFGSDEGNTSVFGKEVDPPFSNMSEAREYFTRNHNPMKHLPPDMS
jgi:hypothetical protein